MVAVISELLSKDQVRTIATKLFSMPFADGSMSGLIAKHPGYES